MVLCVVSDSRLRNAHYVVCCSTAITPSSIHPHPSIHSFTHPHPIIRSSGQTHPPSFTRPLVYTSSFIHFFDRGTAIFVRTVSLSLPKACTNLAAMCVGMRQTDVPKLLRVTLFSADFITTRPKLSGSHSYCLAIRYLQ
jgi:hypothetical protein